MALLLALLGLIVAGDVELEPVRAGNTYGCSRWNNDATKCKDSPYCTWGSGNKCYDDPCLKIMTADATCLGQTVDSTDNIACATVSLDAKFTGADCGDNQDVFDLCVQGETQTTGPPVKPASVYNYCVYAQLRDGACPASVCREFPPEAPDNSLSKHCLRNYVITGHDDCSILSTSDDCGRVPKCYWKSSSCVPDPCYGPEAGHTGTCATWHPVDGDGASVNCKEFKPYTPGGGGSVTTYCVHEDNKNPNLCYLGNPGTDDDNPSDYLDTYPTLVINPDGTLGGKPTCSTTAASCANMGDNCTVVMNKKGGFAGAYCDDGAHGAANILRIPPLLVILLIALVSIFN